MNKYIYSNQRLFWISSSTSLAIALLIFFTNNTSNRFNTVLELLLILCIVLGIKQAQKTYGNLNRIFQVSRKLSGQEDHEKATDELNIINQLELVEKKFNEAVLMIRKIAHKDLKLNWQYISTTDNIGSAIYEVKLNMERYGEEEAKREWRVQGLGLFSQLLRNQGGDVDTFCKEILSNIVKYMNANQGGIYLLDKDEQGVEFMEMAACYAYSRQKKSGRKFYIGEGLIGQCVYEKDTIFLTDIPSNYIKITSGIGEALPRNIIIIPLKVNEMIGALELATFKPLEKHQVAFLEELCTNVASHISSIKVNQRTSLLLEESRALTQELQIREEEMRQNMEELTAIQEEMHRKQAELDGLFKAINTTLLTAEINNEGIIIKSNTEFNELLKNKVPDLSGISCKLFFDDDMQFRKCWNTLQTSQSVSIEHKIDFGGDNHGWIHANYSPVHDKSGSIIKILLLAQEITKRKLQEVELERLSLVADNTDNAVIVTNREGFIEFVNRGFTKITGYLLDEVKGKKPGNILQGEDTDKNTVKRIREKLKKEEFVYEEILNYNKQGMPYWVSLAINPVKDKQGNIYKFISIQANITETKQSALDFKCKLEAISRSNATIEFDFNGYILDVNENFLKITGYSSEEIIGKHHSLFLDDDEKESPDYQKFWSQLKSGESIQGEFRRLCKSGNEIWIKGTYNPIYDLKGNPSRFIKFAVDITQEKLLKLEAEKQELELNNHMAAINKTIAMLQFDLEGNITDCNDIFTGITGYKKEELLTMNYYNLVPNEIEMPKVIMMWNSLREGQFFSGEFKQKDLFGKELWLSGTFNPIPNMEGKSYKVMMFAQFITSEKEKNNELTEMINGFKLILPVIELSSEGIFKNGNEIFLNSFGYKRLELRQKSLNYLLKANQYVNWDDIVSDLENNYYNKSLDFLYSNGDIAQYKAVFIPIKNLENKIYKIMLVLLETTNQVIKKNNININ
jgi:PAS domain S-box-containing protein